MAFAAYICALVAKVFANYLAYSASFLTIPARSA